MSLKYFNQLMVFLVSHTSTDQVDIFVRDRLSDEQSFEIILALACLFRKEHIGLIPLYMVYGILSIEL
jgi:hypothetical protein